MARPLKILLLAIGALIALVVVAAVALVMWLDPNDYKPQITALVRESTGRELTIEDIDLSIFPVLGVRMHQARLSNAPDFGDEPFAAIERVSVGVRLMPLLTDDRLEVRKVELHGLRLNLARAEDGSSNWDDLLARLAEEDDEATAVQDDEASVEVSTTVRDFDIAGIEIADAAVSFDDRQARQHWQLTDASLETGALRPGEPFDLDAAATVSESAQALTAELALSGTVRPGTEQQPTRIENLQLTLDTSRQDTRLHAVLSAALSIDSAAQIYTADDLRLALTASGDAVPAGEQRATLNAAARYDGAAGTARLSDVEIRAAEVVASATITAEGLNGDSPRFAGPIAVQPFDARAVLAALGQPAPHTADADALGHVALDAQLAATPNSAALQDLTLDLDDQRLTGRVALTDLATQALRFTLAAPKFDVDRYLPPREAGAQGERENTDPDGDVDAIEIPAEALRGLDVVGTLRIGELIAHGMTVRNASVAIDGPAGRAKTARVSGQLFGGSADLSASLDPRGVPAVTLQGSLSSIQIEPLLVALTGDGRLRGTGTVGFDLAAVGETVGALKRDLDGTLRLSLADGALKGIDLGALIRRSQATLRGEQYQDSGPVETDFASLSVSATIVDGVLSSNDLDARSPLFRLAGDGRVNLVEQRLDYTARPKIVETSKGQGGRDLQDLAGVTIPVRITGSFSDPSVRLDIEDALKQKARARVQEELEEHEDEIKERLNDALGNLLGGRRRSAPPAQPAEPPAGEDGGT